MSENEIVCPRQWGLTGQERRALMTLLQAEKPMKAAEVAEKVSAYSDRANLDGLGKVIVCRIRAKLTKFGLGACIGTSWGRGYVISEEMRAAILEACSTPALERAA